MLNRSASWALALLMIGIPADSRLLTQPPSHTPGALLGVWRGTMDNLPVVEITLTDEGGSLSGAVLFYLHRRDSPQQPFAVSPGLAEPLLDLKVDGLTLEFRVSHRRAHPPRTLNDPPIPFHLTITGHDRADLVNERENQRLVLVRTDY